MIKLKDIMVESKVSHLLNEYFRSNILRKLSSGNDWKLDKDLYTWTPSDITSPQSIVFDTGTLGYSIESTDTIIINGRWKTS